MNGIVIINKEEGLTSFDVVYKVKKILNIKKAGHTGTLDPMATGVLPIMLGKATKAISLLPDEDKEYEATFKLGLVTNTLDITGKVLNKENSNVKLEDIEKVLANFIGNISQIPPMYSAIKQNGKKLYELARSGKQVERKARNVKINYIKILNFNENKQECKILVGCSKGTYIRSLCDDIGKSLNLRGACTTKLVRTKACGFNLKDSITLGELEKLTQNDQLDGKIIQVDKAFACYKKIKITEKQSKRFKNGNFLSTERIFDLGNLDLKEGEGLRVYSNENKFLGLGKLGKDKINILKILCE